MVERPLNGTSDSHRNSLQVLVGGARGGGSIALPPGQSPSTYLFHACHAEEVLNRSNLDDV